MLKLMRYRRVHSQDKHVCVHFNQRCGSNETFVVVEELETGLAQSDHIRLLQQRRQLCLVEHKMLHVRLVHDAGALLLTQLVDGSRRLVVAEVRHAHASCPLHVYHVEALGVPHVRLEPAISPLA